MNYNARQESLLAIQGAMHLYRSISQGEDAFNYQGPSCWDAFQVLRIQLTDLLYHVTVQFLRSLLVVSNRQLAEQTASIPQTPSGLPPGNALPDHAGNGTHLQPPVDASRPTATAPGTKGAIDDLSPSAVRFGFYSSFAARSGLLN